MKRLVTWWKQYIEYLRGEKLGTVSLGVNEVRAAGEWLIRKEQERFYAQDIRRMREKENVRRKGIFSKVRRVFDRWHVARRGSFGECYWFLTILSILLFLPSRSSLVRIDCSGGTQQIRTLGLRHGFIGNSAKVLDSEGC